MHLTVKFIILQAKKQRELCVRAQIRVKVLTVELETESKVKLDDASERPCPLQGFKGPQRLLLIIKTTITITVSLNKGGSRWQETV